MTIWESKPPENREYAAVRLMRVPMTGTITGIVTSAAYVGCYTHWDAYRTQPCEGPKCQLCLEGKPRRWQAYLSLMSQTTKRQIVLQITPLCAEALDAEIKRYGYLRGLLAAFGRVAKRPNARVYAEIRQLPDPYPDLPEGVDIRKYMSMIWQSNGDLT